MLLIEMSDTVKNRMTSVGLSEYMVETTMINSMISGIDCSVFFLFSCRQRINANVNPQALNKRKGIGNVYGNTINIRMDS